MRILAVMLVLLAGLAPAPAQQTETTYFPRAETSYRPESIQMVPAARDFTAITSSETRFNPEGTVSSSEIGLISTRRAAPEFPAFLLGMQDASLRQRSEALNVAPLSAESLQEQAEVLALRGVNIFLVDAPDPSDAQAFMRRSETLARQVALITSELPRDFLPPAVIDSPIVTAERVGEEAIRLVGNVPVEVTWYLGPETPESQREGIIKSFRKPFDNVAQNIRLTEFNPDAPAPSLSPPAVICVLTERDSRRLAPTLRMKYPESKIVCAGQSPELVAAFDAGLVDVRVRPDYTRLLSNGIREARQKSEFPIILHPATDKRVRTEDR